MKYLNVRSLGYACIAMGLVCALILSKRKSKTVIDYNKQLQVAGGAKDILPEIKKNDWQAMHHLLEKAGWNKSRFTAQEPAVVTDIGCSNGDWVLDELIKLGIWTIVHGFDPHQEKIGGYQDNINKRAQAGQPMFFGSATLGKLEDEWVKLKKSDIVLWSHGPYYTKSFWQCTDVPLERHLLTKITSALNKEGILCVMMQSGDHRYSQYPLNEDIEDLTYPMIERTKGQSARPMPIRRQQESFSNAELFELAFYQYAKRTQKTWGIDFDIFTQPSVTHVTVKDLNFSYDAVKNCYPQSEAVLNFLNFYTRNDYQKFSAEDQKQLLHYLRDHCQSGENEFTVTHVNKVMLIIPKYSDTHPIQQPVFLSLAAS